MYKHCSQVSMYIALSGGRNGGAGEERVRGLVSDISFPCLRPTFISSQVRGERYPRFLIEWIYCWIESCQFQHFESNFELNFFEFNNVLNWILSKIFLLNILLNWILSQNFLLNFLLNWIGLKNWKSIVFWIDIVILYPKIP